MNVAVASNFDKVHPVCASTHTVACQREGTRVLPRPWDHLGRMVMVMSAPLVVNRTRRWRRGEVVAAGGTCCGSGAADTSAPWSAAR